MVTSEIFYCCPASSCPDRVQPHRRKCPLAAAATHSWVWLGAAAQCPDQATLSSCSPLPAHGAARRRPTLRGAQRPLTVLAQPARADRGLLSPSGLLPPALGCWSRNHACGSKFGRPDASGQGSKGLGGAGLYVALGHVRFERFAFLDPRVVKSRGHTQGEDNQQRRG